MCNLSELIAESAVLQADKARIKKMLRSGKTPEEIKDFCDYPSDIIKEAQDELNSGDN